MHQNSLRDLSPESGSRQTISTPPPCLRQCAHIHLPSTSGLQISARNFSKPFLPSSRCLASDPCVPRTSVLAKTSPPSRDLHRLYPRSPAPAPRRSPQTKVPAFR